MFDPFGDSSEANALNKAEDHEEVGVGEPLNGKRSNQVKDEAQRHGVVPCYFLRNEYLVAFLIVVGSSEVDDDVHDEYDIHY